MPCKNCYLELKVLKDLGACKAGQVVKVQAKNGMPVVKFWRDRLRDAQIDNCVEIVKPKKRVIKKEELKDDNG